MRSIALIGSRDISKLSTYSFDAILAAAEFFAKEGDGVATGAALGTDQRCGERYLEAGGQHLELWLPWGRKILGNPPMVDPTITNPIKGYTRTYEALWVNRMIQRYGSKRVQVHILPERSWENSPQERRAYESVKLHPNALRLSEPEKKLMARNYMIIEGKDMVLATPQPPCRGGTAHGLAVADSLGIPHYNLSSATDLQAWLDVYSLMLRGAYAG